jgi:hypothetical protein
MAEAQRNRQVGLLNNNPTTVAAAAPPLRRPTQSALERCEHRIASLSFEISFAAQSAQFFAVQQCDVVSERLAFVQVSVLATLAVRFRDESCDIL